MSAPRHPLHEAARARYGVGHAEILQDSETSEHWVQSKTVTTRQATPRSRSPGLVKTFGNVRALDGLDLTVARGEVHGFLGPNGAGKSTTIRVLLGLLRKDAGEVRLFGGDPWRDAAELHRRLAYVPGDVNLWPNLTGGQAIDLLGRLRGGLDEKRRAELIERFELDPTKKGRSYSKGNRQKVALVAALASDVELLVLDEPTSGLDPLMEAVFQEYVDRFRDAGARRAAEQPHPGRGRAAVRPGQHHPGRPVRRVRHPRRPPPPHPYVDRRRAGRAARRRCARLPDVHDLVIEGNRARFEVETSGPRRRPRHPPGRRRALADQPAADARGAVPAPLRRPDRDDEPADAGAGRAHDRHLAAAAHVPAPGPLAATSGGPSA